MSAWRIIYQGVGVYYVEQTHGDPDCPYALWWARGAAFTFWGAKRKLARLRDERVVYVSKDGEPCN